MTSGKTQGIHGGLLAVIILAVLAAIVGSTPTAIAALRGHLTTVKDTAEAKVTHQTGTSTPTVAAARVALPRLVVAVGDRAGYARAKFGAAWTDDQTAKWGHNGCGTRDDILGRDLTGVQRRSRCVVVAGTLHDPYTRRTIQFRKADAGAVQIDHVVPLAYAWAHGARGWPQQLRTRFANDPGNLLAVDGPTNVAKGDRGPGLWVPPNAGYRCQYAVLWVLAATTYRLTVAAADKTALSRYLGTCPAGGTR